MNRIVPRTCTVIERGTYSGDPENAPWPSHDLRALDACVLLGAPGVGKTTAFETEAKRTGGLRVTARDFTTFDDRAEWRDTTLFIDGLDETRAGSADGRTPLDNIRTRLDRLDRPRFRLSCREADWFGANDRDRLKNVSRDGKVTVLRLNPLSDDDISEILRANFGIEDADEFVGSARERGIDALLGNPQSLKMLATAVADGVWPESRLQTFDMACRTLLREHNEEHRIATRNGLEISDLMNAAGRLCAVQLLTGGAGYNLLGGESDREYLGLETIPDEDRDLLRHALGTKLFEGPSDGPRAPVHRQIAEFLGARHLATLIDQGLPVRRVLAVMSGHDGIPVSELRGLAAWLAAHGKRSRAEIVARDPLGTVLYGDVREFSTEDKCRVLDRLLRDTKKNPRFVGAIQMDSRLGDVVTADMEDVFRGFLTDPARDDAQQAFVVILIESLAHGQPLPGLADVMIDIIRDAARWPRIRKRALEAFVRNETDKERVFSELEALVADVGAERVPDPDDELLGCLLTELYPARLSVSDIMQYLRTPKRPSIVGGYVRFWTGQVPETSTNAQLAELLDVIARRYSRQEPVFVRSTDYEVFLHSVLAILLRRLLEKSQDKVDSKQLFEWLGVASDVERRASKEELGSVGEWLSRNPATMKEIIELGLKRCVGSEDFRQCVYAVECRLFGATRPPDFGSWCLDRAMAAEDGGAATWFIAEVARGLNLRSHDEGISREAVERRLVGNTYLLNLFHKERAELEGSRIWFRERRKRYELTEQTRDRQIRRDWRERVKSRESAFREGRASPELLHDLARIYFGEFVDIVGLTGTERLRDLLGDDESLIAAVLEGFRGSIARSDAPTYAEILELNAMNRTHRLALPIMAGLDEQFRNAPDGKLLPDEAQIRVAVAIHYTVPMRPYTRHPAQRTPPWFPPLLASHPDVVANVLIRSTASRMRSGADYVPGLHELQDEDHAAVSDLASLPLLEAFPVRCSNRQLRNLSILLGSVRRDGQEKRFLELIDRKLAHRSMNVGQRIYWLAAGLTASPERYLEKLESCVAGNERRIGHLAEFFVANGLSPRLIIAFDVSVLSILIRLIGGSSRPPSRHPESNSSNSAERRWLTSAVATGLIVETYINYLASIPSRAASEALEALSSDDNLRAWRFHLDVAAYRQKAARREAEFRRFDVENVVAVLDNQVPANAADLAALTIEHLREISTAIQDGNTSDWRQYWNVDSYNRPQDPKPEDACRDALLSDLNIRMGPLNVDAQPEARYADEKRSDIRVSFNGFNVPVEIKKSCHRDLWSAVRTQLIAKYTRDPGTDGYGIYIVFWFGRTEQCQPTPSEGPPPKRAGELEERLNGKLSDDERRKISVCVIDVSRRDT